MKDAILKVKNIYKNFGATKALTDISLQLDPGEVRGLIGENGSGKSTLSNIISGAFPPSLGEMELHGASYSPSSPFDAKKNGIVILAQEEGTIAGITVAENIFLGEEGRLSKSGMVNIAALNRESKRILENNGLSDVNPADLASSYSFETRKMIEVARALEADPDILIVDETTTALSQSGRERIYKIIDERRSMGKCVLFISHDLDEIKRVCDSVTVLRDGIYVDTIERERITPELMRTLMIGRELTGAYYRADNKCSFQDEVALKVEGISYGTTVKDVSFDLHKGEILGIGGLTECGMHELCKLIIGALPRNSGKVLKPDEGIEIKTPEDAVDHKIAYLPKDRDQESLFQETSIEDNIVASSMKMLERKLYISPKKERQLASEKASEMAIKMSGIKQFVSNLSGGNKQKVAIAKWLANDSSILIMDCPTRGIDIGVKAHIYKLMEKLKEENKAIIMVSEEMEELMGMSDRIFIMKDGVVNGQFERSEQLTQYDIIEAMI